MGRKYFGTDGIRGKVGEAPITPEFILKLGWAAGKALSGQGRDKVIVGKDTRISGYMFESVLEAGFSAAGVDTVILGPMPTPAIAYLTKTLRACAGIVISASHNPHYDNGIKFFSADGRKLSDEIEEKIEALLDEPMTTVASEKLGKASRLHAEGRYIEFCKHAVSSPISLNGLKIVLDCAHGATYKVAPAVFSELRADVVEIGVNPNGLNINVDSGSTKPANLQAAVKQHQAHLGIAFDGDGDRVVMVDEDGGIVDGDELVYVIAKARHQKQQLTGPVVGTLMSNLGLEHAFQRDGIEFLRAKVGDRYVMEMLQAQGGTIGGESSGHILCLDRTSTGDGIISALQVLEIMIETGKSLAELRAPVTKYPQHMINVAVTDRGKFAASAEIESAVKLAEAELAEAGRVLLRPSGTEPVVRVMVEGRDEQQIVRVAQDLAAVVEKAQRG